MQSRRPHKKSRVGCLNCKRRKVKVSAHMRRSHRIPGVNAYFAQCDESKPSCMSCSRFGVSCVWPMPKQHIPPTVAPPCTEPLPKCTQSFPRTKGRGRPRNNWSHLLSHTQFQAAPRGPDVQHQNSLNIQDAELLLHFVQSTARTLAGNDSTPDSSISQFWTTNAPRIGISYPFVLHLIYSLTAYHISSQYPTGHERRQHYRDLASSHLSRGTAGLASTTSSLDKNNCGAAYLGATLLCYCTFAAGPSAPEDLMICHLGTHHNVRWVNLVSGLRLIRQAFGPQDLFSGLMSPLGPSIHNSDSHDSHVALCKELGTKRLSWESALSSLDCFVSSQRGPFSQCCRVELAELRKVFEGVYGDASGAYNVSTDYRHVLGWLYRLNGEYIRAVQDEDAAALVILAHFSVLLKVLKDEWWLHSWAKHICFGVGGIVKESVMEWPTTQFLRSS